MVQVLKNGKIVWSDNPDVGDIYNKYGEHVGKFFDNYNNAISDDNQMMYASDLGKGYALTKSRSQIFRDVEWFIDEIAKENS